MSAKVVLLVDYLEPLLASLPSSELPVFMSRLLKRARRESGVTDGADRLRLQLFGLDPKMAMPAAALAAMGQAGFDSDAHYLRLDPVTLRADMTRVFLLDSGWSDYAPKEREQWRSCAMQALLDAPCQIFCEDDHGYILRLDQALTFTFPGLQQARGADVGELIPRGSDARTWRKVFSELQVELHNHAVNQERRSRGLVERNAGWFWGGGALPPPAGRLAFDVVCSNHPISLALARLNRCPVQETIDGKQSALIDLAQVHVDARDEALELDRWLTVLLPAAESGKIDLEVHDGAGQCYRYGRWQRFQFWK